MVFVVSPSDVPAWYQYYWKVLKCCGAESYRTWRGEMLASVVIAVAAFIITTRDDPFAAKNLQIALVATAIGLGAMGLWHLVRSPWILQKRTVLNQSEDDAWGWGLFGLLIVGAIFFGVAYGSTQAYHAKVPELVVAIPSADPGAKNAEIIADRDRQIDELKRKLKSGIPIAGRSGEANESSEVGIYPVSHDLRPGVPKMEYVMTTRKMRSPVQITATCDFPISDGSVTFLKPAGMGGSAQSTNSLHLSERQFRLLILSPVWAESAPMWVTVFFEGKVDRMPSCQFQIE